MFGLILIDHDIISIWKSGPDYSTEVVLQVALSFDEHNSSVMLLLTGLEPLHTYNNFNYYQNFEPKANY